MIYKICPREMWDKALAGGNFEGAAIDLADGFIHFSTAAQVRETAAKHFAGQEDLLLVAIDETKLGDDLKWEVSRGGDLFPHLYRSFDPTIAHSVVSMPLDNDGVHVISV